MPNHCHVLPKHIAKDMPTIMIAIAAWKNDDPDVGHSDNLCFAYWITVGAIYINNRALIAEYSTFAPSGTLMCSARNGILQ